MPQEYVDLALDTFFAVATADKGITDLAFASCASEYSVAPADPTIPVISSLCFGRTGSPPNYQFVSANVVHSVDANDPALGTLIVFWADMTAAPVFEPIVYPTPVVPVFPG